MPDMKTRLGYALKSLEEAIEELELAGVYATAEDEPDKIDAIRFSLIPARINLQYYRDVTL
ncbi:hypothetical protein NCPPB3778_74 [Rathayibacter phage NCPPB3778]|nr:hypothetical protein NCPPB3778_74 [Rathayibacter phage NCPPB3778]